VILVVRIADPSPLAASLVGFIRGVCADLAPGQRGGRTIGADPHHRAEVRTQTVLDRTRDRGYLDDVSEHDLPALAPRDNLVALRDRREQAIARLTDAFSSDLFDVDEFDRRIDLAHRARSLAELDDLTVDLAPAPVTTTALAPTATDLEAAHWPARKRWIAVFGGFQKRGRWTVPRELRVIAWWGGASIDLREAVLAPGVTVLRVTAVMGGVEILVPPWLAVECDASAILGGFEELERGHGAPDPDRALLRITGLAVMGGVSIETRLPGESARQARKRMKQERRRPAEAEPPAQLPRAEVRSLPKRDAAD
jgi:hypothetical protein